MNEPRFFDIKTQMLLTAEQVMEVTASETAPKRTFSWFRVYPKFLSPLKRILDGPKFLVILWILQNFKPSSNRFVGSYKFLAKEIGVSKSTVQRVMEGLQENDLIRQSESGEWMLNPTVVYAGRSELEEVALKKYERLPVKRYPRANVSNIPPKEDVDSSLANRLESILNGGDADGDNDGEGDQDDNN